MTWIIVNDWERFQHYKDRQPPWIKNYTELMSDDEYRKLPLATRGILHGIFLEYARARSALAGDTRSLSAVLGQRISNAQIKSLVQAGFITLSASKPGASVSRAREEAEQEKEQEQSSSTSTQDQEDLPFEQELAATRLLAAIGATNGTTREALDRYELPPAAWYAAAEELERTAGVRNRAGYVVTMFRTWKQEGRYA